MSQPIEHLAMVVLCASWMWLQGCNYSLGVPLPPSVRTVAVPTFNNNTFPLRREIEYELTSAVRKEIQSQTSLQISSSGGADLVIHGTIVEFREQVVAEGKHDQKIESTIVASVSLVWRITRIESGGRRR